MFGYHDTDRGVGSLAPFKAGGLMVDTTPKAYLSGGWALGG